MPTLYIETSIVSYSRQRPSTCWTKRRLAIPCVGIPIPIICTPEEMVDDDSEEE